MSVRKPRRNVLNFMRFCGYDNVGFILSVRISSADQRQTARVSMES